jgi:hypothetical protein
MSSVEATINADVDDGSAYLSISAAAATSSAMERSGQGEMERSGQGEMERSGQGEMERSGQGEMMALRCFIQTLMSILGTSPR